MTGRIGVVALARPTFDVPYAEEVAAAAFAMLDEAAPSWIGPRRLLFDAEATQRAVDQLAGTDLDALLLMQVTFTDATMTKTIAAAIDAPLVLWSFPEERTGGRLRLNSLCGINLAAFALRRAGRDFSYIYSVPSTEAAAQLSAALGGHAVPESSHIAPPTPSNDHYLAADEAIAALRRAKTGVIGNHPDGFDPCGYDAVLVRDAIGVNVEAVPLEQLFTAASAASDERVAVARERAVQALGPLDDLDQESLDQSLRIFCGLQDMAAARGWNGFATRCWPECFTEFGAAACAPQAMMTDNGIPGGCEADAYGTLTSLLLQELAGEPPFIADLVDVDIADDSAAFWHCGVAPLHMADPASGASATIHSNRRKPLLHEFALKPGRVTIARISQAGGSHSLVIGGGEVLPVPLPFSGTAGVIRFDRPAQDVLATVMASGLEHHYGIVYGDFRSELYAVAERWNMPVIALA